MASEHGGAAPDGDALRAELALLLRRLTVELDAVGQRFAEEEGLGRTDVRALTRLMDATRTGRPMTAGTLGAAVDLSSASVTALVDRLERMGHVRRARDEQDRRRVVVEVSDTAMDAGRRFFGSLQRDLMAQMAGYSEAELAVVHRWLTGMSAVIEQHSRPGEVPAPPPAG